LPADVDEEDPDPEVVAAEADAPQAMGPADAPELSEAGLYNLLNTV
jgi:hypothetical protein